MNGYTNILVTFSPIANCRLICKVKLSHVFVSSSLALPFSACSLLTCEHCAIEIIYRDKNYKPSVSRLTVI